MMQTKDLMINDLVRFTSDQWETEEDARPFRITGIGEPDYPEYMPYLLIAELSNAKYHIDLFEPIPFAAEIFEKNGFERNTFNGTIILSKKSYTDINWYNVIVEISKDAEGIQRWDSVCITIQKAGANLKLNNQSYFHQLQHALRLVGLSELADNLKF